MPPAKDLRVPRKEFMDVKEELAKSTIGKIVTGLLLLAGFLIAIVWRETLYGKWEQVAGGFSKPALMALLGLAVIAIVLETAWVGYLLYSGRERKPSPPPLPPPPEKLLTHFGVYWDSRLNPLCPICKQAPLHMRYKDEETSKETLRCPSCIRDYVLRDDEANDIELVDVKKYLRGEIKHPYWGGSPD
jgi:hypothetical protein